MTTFTQKTIPWLYTNTRYRICPWCGSKALIRKFINFIVKDNVVYDRSSQTCPDCGCNTVVISKSMSNFAGTKFFSWCNKHTILKREI